MEPQTTQLPRVEPAETGYRPELDPSSAVGQGILSKAERTTDPEQAARLGWILMSPEAAQEFLNLAYEYKCRSKTQQGNYQGKQAASYLAEPSQEPDQAPRNRISYLHGIALKERGVILHGLAALARRHGVPETGRDGLNSSRREKLLGLIELLLRHEERGAVLKSSYGTLAAKLETSESTIKDLLTKVPLPGLYSMEFNRRDQMWEIRSGPALEPQEWEQLLEQGQKALCGAIAANRKENNVWGGERSWQECRNYPKRKQYKRTPPVLTADRPSRNRQGETSAPQGAAQVFHPGELHLGSLREPLPAIQQPKSAQMLHPGEVHLGMNTSNNSSNTLTKDISAVHNITLTVNSITAMEEALQGSADAVIDHSASSQVKSSSVKASCSDQPRCSDRSPCSLTTHLGVNIKGNAALTPSHALDYGSVVSVKGCQGRYVVKGLDWGDTADDDTVRCVPVTGSDQWITFKRRDVCVIS